MKLTNEADEMVQRLGKTHTAEHLAAVIALAGRAAREEMCTRVYTFHIREAMEELPPQEVHQVDVARAAADPLELDDSTQAIGLGNTIGSRRHSSGNRQGVQDRTRPE